MMRFFPALSVVSTWWLSVTVVGLGQTVQIPFDAPEGVVFVSRPLWPGVRAEEVVVQELLAGPSPEEAARGLTSPIPRGVRLMEFVSSGDGVTLDLSPEVLSGLGESSLTEMFSRVRLALDSFPEILSVRLTCCGSVLSAYLPPTTLESVPPASPRALGGKGCGVAATGLAGKIITIGPSHGRFHNGSGWYWQRSDPCGLGEAVLEDTNSIRLMQFLYQYLSQDGATVHVPRQLDEGDCCHSATGLPWWKMAARYWLEHSGLPSAVWDSSDTHLNDDIRARPLFADYRGSDIYIAHHTNAYKVNQASGTEVYRDTEMEHPAHEANSYSLALAIKTHIESAIRDVYDSTWPIRNGGQPRDSAGGFGEIRIPNRPACLIELAFHDNCNKDGPYLTDNFFRSTAEWGVYQGVCSYFGVTPTWDRYSCEYVSDTIPATMVAGGAYNVSVTFRNRGVVWSVDRGFKLGAVGDSDPFTVSTRSPVAGEVRPGQTFTFSFTLTAPAAAGRYTTDWRMVREAVAWFGPTVGRQIQVTLPPSPGDLDGDSDVDLDDLAIMQRCLTGSGVNQGDLACAQCLIEGNDGDVDGEDLRKLVGCMSGAGIKADPDCGR
ncbi:MAG TPA: N-acetylmuramoyl-L-alanine amidase [Phycisphaerae bacterium]|nr:N-acetylmuramoyl-L-alanine amidase [Phycisphaerae bacterium]HRY71054.1 N-acetylmuramoyl-L-alanine amidase [Phycisphaerae bacterium]HSA29144.1 N-acetylmuramoyl-L-alanine amidase [Phycisphaerae bacterium]